MSDDLQFGFTAKDDVTPALQSMQRALSQLDTKLGGTDKSIGQLEKSLAKLSSQWQQAGNGAQQLINPLQQAQKAMDDLTAAGLRYNSKGRVITAQGTFATKEQAAAYNTAASSLNNLTAAQNTSNAAADRAATHNAKQMANLREFNSRITEQNTVLGQATKSGTSLSAVLENVPPASTRYALYDVSNSLAILGAALITGSVAAVTFAASYERAFADVERTVNDLDPKGLQALEKSLIQLANTTPIAFEELAHIASLGGQLGISGAGIENFVETVAKLGTVTNLSVDAASNALGRFKALLGVSEREFGNLGSAITKVGVNSVATESQIVNVSVQISSMAGYAGYTADQVIGLSGALASIGVPPELARGTFTRLFSKIGEAASAGGLQLDEFARVAGVTSKAFSASFGTPEFSGMFEKFVAGLAREGSNAINVLHNLGITSVRDVPLLLRLANAANSAGEKAGLLAETLKDAKKGWDDNTELNKQYQKITDTTVEKLKILGNQFKSFIAILGSNLLPVFGFMLDALKTVATILQFIINIPVVGQIISWSVVIAAVVGALLLLTAGLARAGGAALGMIQANSALMASFIATRTALQEMNLSLAATPGFFGKAVVGARGLGVAFGAMLGPVGLVLTALTLLPTLAEGVQKAAGVTNDASAAFKRLKNDASGAASFNIFSGTSATSFAAFAKAQQGLIESTRGMGQWAGAVTRDIQMVDQAMAEQVKNGNAEEAAKQYQTLRKEWFAAGGTAKGFNAAFVDTTTALREFKPEAKTVNDAIRLIGDDAEVGADKIQALSDALFAGANSFLNTSSLIEANQQSQQDAAQATADANNAAAEDSHDSWQNYYDGQKINLEAYLTSLEKQVAAQDEWKANIETLSKRGLGEAIIQDLAKLGEQGAPLVAALAASTEPELAKYAELWRKGGEDSAQAFANGAATNEFIIKNALNNVGVSAQASLVTALKSGMPIEQVMAQFNLDAAGNPIQVKATAAGPGNAIDSTNKFLQWAQQQHADIYLRAQITAYGNPAVIAALNGQGFSTTGPANTRINVGQYASGGYTGDGGKYQAAGLVHKGEFVMNKEATSRIGVGELYAMMRGQSSARSMPRGPQAGFAGGGAVGGGSWSTMDASSLQAIMAIANRPIYLYTDDRLIAESASRGGTILAQNGTN